MLEAFDFAVECVVIEHPAENRLTRLAAEAAG